MIQHMERVRTLLEHPYYRRCLQEIEQLEQQLHDEEAKQPKPAAPKAHSCLPRSR